MGMVEIGDRATKVGDRDGSEVTGQEPDQEKNG